MNRWALAHGHVHSRFDASILDYFGIDQKEDIPAVRIINIEQDMAKYKYSSEVIDDTALEAFCQSYIDGTLQV